MAKKLNGNELEEIVGGKADNGSYFVKYREYDDPIAQEHLLTGVTMPEYEAKLWCQVNSKIYVSVRKA